MPDKHEVGGSSPLGPTSNEGCEWEGKVDKNSECISFYASVVRVHLGLPAAEAAKVNAH